MSTFYACEPSYCSKVKRRPSPVAPTRNLVCKPRRGCAPHVDRTLVDRLGSSTTVLGGARSMARCHRGEPTGLRRMIYFIPHAAMADLIYMSERVWCRRTRITMDTGSA